MATSKLTVDSANSTWVFDTVRMRFRRLLKGIEVGGQRAATAWRPYFGLRIDPVSGTFDVLLDAEGKRLLTREALLNF
jgi:hypothetical protein